MAPGRTPIFTSSHSARRHSTRRSESASRTTSSRTSARPFRAGKSASLCTSRSRARAPLISTTSVTAGSTCSSSRGRAPGRAVCATRAALPVHARVRPRTWVGRRTMRSSSRRTLVFLQQIQPGWRVRRSILRRVLQLTVIVPSFREARWHRRSLRERCSPSPSAT